MIRLLELRNEKNMSQREMAKNLGVSQGTYCNWENNRTEPSIEQLIEIARFFSVSVDYLVGNSDEIGIINVKKPLSKEELQVLSTLNALSDQSKTLLLNFINSLDK